MQFGHISIVVIVVLVLSTILVLLKIFPVYGYFFPISGKSTCRFWSDIKSKDRYRWVMRPEYEIWYVVTVMDYLC